MNFRSLMYDIEKYGLLRFIRREVREFLFKLRRTLRWIPVVWNSIDFDYSALLKLIDFKLLLMVEHMEGCAMSPKAPIMKHPIRKMQIIRCHIDHFLNIDKYIPYIEEPEMDFDELISRKTPPEIMRRYRQQDEAEKWHFNEIWRRLAKDCKGFWC